MSSHFRYLAAAPNHTRTEVSYETPTMKSAMPDTQPTFCDLRTEGNVCPMAAAEATPSVVSQSDELVFPKHRQTVVQFLVGETGAAALHLYYGDKEISFDDPDLFVFGETLASQARFAAGDAMAWGDGYAWSRVQDLLQQLIDEGVLVHADVASAAASSPTSTIQPSPLPPTTCPVTRFWDDCEAITQDLAGRSVELGYLEVILPIFRVAHAALDADHRQVGEANVFPPGLRLDVPTEWRTCNLPGTRYLNKKPMNVTAMRVMRAHWSQMMAAVIQIREAYLRRFPEADCAFTIGHLERLSVAVLAVPTYQLMRKNNRVANSKLHPALSSLFRVTDGVRMTMHQMLFLPGVEPTRSPNEAVTVDEIIDYAERNYSFHSEHGVCAGPGAMVRELIQVLLEGRGNADYSSVVLDPAAQNAFDDLDAAIDYGLLGLRVHAVAFSRFPTMGRAYEDIAGLVDHLPMNNGPRLAAFRDRMQAHRSQLKMTYLAHENWRISREATYAEIYRQCGRGVTHCDEGPGLDSLLAPVWTDADRQTETELQNMLRAQSVPRDAASEAFVRELSARVMDFLLREQAMLRATVAAQRIVNSHLGREQPDRVLSAADLNVHSFNPDYDSDHLPNLTSELEKLLGLHIELDVNRLAIAKRDVAA